MYLDFVIGQKTLHIPNVSRKNICFSSHVPVCDTECVPQSILQRKKLRETYLRTNSQNENTEKNGTNINKVYFL